MVEKYQWRITKITISRTHRVSHEYARGFAVLFRCNHIIISCKFMWCIHSYSRRRLLRRHWLRINIAGKFQQMWRCFFCICGNCCNVDYPCQAHLELKSQLGIRFEMLPRARQFHCTICAHCITISHECSRRRRFLKIWAQDEFRTYILHFNSP